MMGPERRSMALSDEERKITAHHEAGHAILNHFLPESDPNYKCTIIPRGRALGVTVKLPEVERYNYGKKYLLSEIVVLLGGRVAEEIMFGEQTTGAQNDFERSTSMARKMVTQWGMSARLGPRTFGRRESMVFLGREMGDQPDYSEKMAELIDEEIRELIDRAHNRARSILVANRERLNYLAKRLAEEETLDPDQLREIFAWQPGTPQPGGTTPKPPPRSEPPASPPPPTGGGDDRARDPLLPPKPGLVWGGDRSNLDIPD